METEPTGDLQILEPPSNEDELVWAPGALDALVAGGEETGRAIGARKLLRALSAAVRKPGDATLKHFYELACEAPVIEIIDDFVPLAAEARLPAAEAAAFARRLAREAPDSGPVKIAIALIGIFGDETDRDLLLALGRYDELTIYAAVALEHLLGEAQEEIWTLAKSTHGWGRIRAVLKLEPHNRPDIRDWLLREGHRNAIMPEEVAWHCAVHGRLAEALRKPDSELLDAAGELLRALIAGGPAEDINCYSEGAEAARLYVRHVADDATIGFGRFLAVRDIRRFLDEAADAAAERPRVKWPAEAEWEIRTAAAAYLGREDWRERVAEGLAGAEDDCFWLAREVAEALGIDTWPASYERQRRGGGSGDQWYHLMQTEDPARIELVLKLAREQLDLARIASGPTPHLGFGPDYLDDGALDMILSWLPPELGWDLIAAGLRGRGVRVRNMALGCLSRWPRDKWPDAAEAALIAGMEREPHEEVRRRFAQLLAGEELT